MQTLKEVERAQTCTPVSMTGDVVLIMKQGLVTIDWCNGETSTRGMDSLSANCKEYFKCGHART